MVRLGPSDLEVFPVCLGGNVFGWTADEQHSFEVLDAYTDAGGNFIDSADSYSAFAPGNVGGESETMLGKWIASRGNRASVVIATKAGRKPDRKGLTRENIRVAVEESLGRLQTDYIDLYYAHADDPDTPLELALETSDRRGLARYIAVQPHYSLVERDGYEGPLAALRERTGLSCVPYWASRDRAHR